MKDRILRYIFIIAIATLSNVPSIASSKTITVGLIKNIPPYNFLDKNGLASGTESSIFKKVLGKKLGYEMKFVSYSFQRLQFSIKKHGADIISAPQKELNKGLYYSKYQIVNYENILVSYNSSFKDIKSIKDLEGKSIIGFQAFHKVIGGEFGKFLENKKQLKETNTSVDHSPNLEVISRMVLKQRTNLAVIDKNIFLYIFEKYKDKYSLDKKKLFFHSLIKQRNGFAPAFKSYIIRNQFDKELGKMIKNGEIESFNEVGQIN
jgi:ABC-type amino acid transport substrate-binding protein